MRRHARNLTVAVSLAIFVLTIVTWVRSYRRADWLGRTWESIVGEVANSGQVGVGWGSGHVSLGWHRFRATPLEGQTLASLPGVPGQPYTRVGWRWLTNAPSMPRTTLGFDISAYWNRPMVEVTNVWAVESNVGLVLPHWFVALVSGALPARHFVGYRRRLQHYRRANNLCIACGYDLRGSTERCPECGQVSAAASS